MKTARKTWKRSFKIDPLSEFYKYLHADLKTSSAALIKAGCIKSVLDEQYIMKNGTTDSDYPEVALVLARMAGPQYLSSSSYRLELGYDVLVSTGKISQASVHRLMWWLYTRGVYLGANKGRFLYKNSQVLTGLTFAAASIGLKPSNAQRNVYGWASLVTIQVELSLPNALCV